MALILTPDEIDAIFSRPQPARVRCYLTAGKDHYEVDRVVGDRIRKVFPAVRASALACSCFQRRAVAELASSGAEQFLVVGPGYEPDTHCIIESIRPNARIIYANNDPLVVVHGTAKYSRSGDEGVRRWISGDPTGDLLSAVTAAGVFDLRRLVVVSLAGTTEYLGADVPAVQAVRNLLADLAPGSALILCQTVIEFAPEIVADVRRVYESSNIAYTPRPRIEVESFFAGLDVLDPGIVPPQRWRPDGRIGIQRRDNEICCLAGVGMKR